MPARYELWLTDDRGVRFRLLQDIAYFSYTRQLDGLGTCNLGVPFEVMADLRPYFQPDWQLEVWRAPDTQAALRLEDVFFLRQPVVYTREDNVQILQVYGRNGMDLLKRRVVAQRPGTSYALKTGTVDDLMKAYVREQMLYGSALDEDGVVDNSRAYPQSEFTVQADGSLGATVTRDFAGRNVFEVCGELAKIAQEYAASSDSYEKVHFDVLPVPPTSNPPSGAVRAWDFRTYYGLRGGDRTAERVFSEANQNIRLPSLAIDHLDEVNLVWVRGNGRGSSQIIASVENSAQMAGSRWNRCEKTIQAASETSVTALQDAGRVELTKGMPKQKLDMSFLNIPAGRTTPRSLYPLDWDLGDRVRLEYAGLDLEVEIGVVYVSLDEAGVEEITGRSVQT